MPLAARRSGSCCADTLTREAWAGQSATRRGTLTLVYDHHRPQLRERLMNVQHEHHDLVVSTLHAHLTHDLCLEVIVLRGPSDRLQKIAAQFRGLKGIFKGELVMASEERLWGRIQRAGLAGDHLARSTAQLSRSTPKFRTGRIRRRGGISGGRVAGAGNRRLQ